MMGHREYQEREGSRRRKKKSHKIYAFIVLALAAAILVAVIFLLFYVQKIEVRGNDYVTEQEIVDAVQNDEFSVNALYILGKYALGKGKTLPCLEQMKVRLKAPWIVKVDVKEKPIVGYVYNGELYSYFDKEGFVVLESSVLLEGVPYIEGLGMGEVKLYQHLESKNTKIFEQILETSREIAKYGLKPDRIVCEGDVICLYIGRIRIRLGKTVSAEKIAQITPILEKIGDKEGTLHLENYSEVQGTVTFQEEPLPQESADGAQPADGAGETPQPDAGGAPESGEGTQDPPAGDAPEPGEGTQDPDFGGTPESGDGT